MQQQLKWRKPQGKCSLHVDDNCVERGDGDGNVTIRNSNDPTGPQLRYTDEEWAAFIRGSDLVHLYAGGPVTLTHGGVTLMPFTEGEWLAFLADATMREGALV